MHLLTCMFANHNQQRCCYPHECQSIHVLSLELLSLFFCSITYSFSSSVPRTSLIHFPVACDPNTGDCSPTKTCDKCHTCRTNRRVTPWTTECVVNQAYTNCLDSDQECRMCNGTTGTCDVIHTCSKCATCQTDRATGKPTCVPIPYKCDACSKCINKVILRGTRTDICFQCMYAIVLSAPHTLSCVCERVSECAHKFVRVVMVKWGRCVRITQARMYA